MFLYDLFIKKSVVLNDTKNVTCEIQTSPKVSSFRGFSDVCYIRNEYTKNKC